MAKSELIIILVILIVVVAGSVTAYVFLAQLGSSGFNGKDLYVGEYGFGSTSSVTSPGLTLTFTMGQTVTLTLHNIGEKAHNWAIVDAKSPTAIVLWNSQIANASNPVAPDDSASVTFTVDNAGSYYYISQVGDDVSLGIWGVVTVNP
jgi:plastocyanin